MINMAPPRSSKRLPGRHLANIFMLLLSVFVFHLATNPAGVLAADFEILTPRPGSTVIARNPETHLVLRQSETGLKRLVRVEKTGAILTPLVSMEGEEFAFLHFRLPLVPGKNGFTLLPDDQRLELKYQRVQAEVNLKNLGKDITFFHQNDKLPESCRDCHELTGSKTIIPGCPTKQTSCVTCHPQVVSQGVWKHSTTINQQCLSCHQQSVDPWRIGFPILRIQEVCFSCHTSNRSWFSSASIHGPLVVGGCTLCHNPHGEDHRRQLWAEGSRDICIICHSDKRNLVTERQDKRMPYVHGIIFGAGCVACHDPHATDQSYMLVKPTNKLCSGCHPDVLQMSAGHPVANHPVSAPRERRRPGRQLTCVSCHDPHGTPNKLMLIKPLLGGHLCRECHKR